MSVQDYTQRASHAQPLSLSPLLHNHRISRDAVPEGSPSWWFFQTSIELPYENVQPVPRRPGAGRKSDSAHATFHAIIRGEFARPAGG